MAWCTVLGVCLGLSLVRPASAQVLLDEPPEEVRGVDVAERLGEQIPLDLTFTTSEGQQVELSKYFDGEKPVVLVLVYFECPIVCSVVLDRAFESFYDLDYTIGEDFNVVVLSFDHTEGIDLAAGKKSHYLTLYNRPITPELRDGAAFLTGDSSNIRRLADAVGFEYRLLENGEYAHPVSLTVLSPQGTVSRYLYGFSYPPKQMKLSLLEASEGRIAQSLGDRIMHFCFRYDPTAGAYSVEAMAVMRLAGGLTVLGIAVLICGLFISEKIKGRRSEAGGKLESSRSAGTSARVVGQSS